MAFNFGQLATVKPTNTVSYLKPYNIYDNITIKGSEVKSGTTSSGNPWKSLNITFGNEEGEISHSVFYFDEKDPKNWERPVRDMPNGGKKEYPSNAEELQNTIAAIGYAFFPEDFKKLQGVVSKISTTEQLMDYFKKFIDKNVDKISTSMKVIGRESNNRVYACLPKFTGIAQAKDDKRAAENGVNVGEWYTWMVSPFGNNLMFSSYEQEKADSYKNAKPTKMEEVSNDVDTDDSNIDFDSLL